MRLARHESTFEPAGEASLDAREVIDALRRPSPMPADKRSATMANCLAGGEGWRDSASRLGGSFAALGEKTGLTDRKE